MHRMAVLALPDVVAFDLAIPMQVFGHVSERTRYDVVVAAERPVVPTTTGFTLGTPHRLDTLDAADSVVVPGFSPRTCSAEALDALRRAHARGARMMSICTGAFALAHAGILDGRTATTHWRQAEELAGFGTFTVDPDVLFVDGGDVLTSAGIAAGLDLALHVYRLDHGAEAAARVARRMVVAPHRDGGQAQYVDRPLPTSGPTLGRTCDWAIEHLAEPLDVAGLARHAGYAPRTFARRFVAETGRTPLAWLTAQRLLLARRLLETTDDGVELVAQRAGLGSATNLRVLLRREVGVSPSAYRATFRGRPHAGSR